MKNLRFYKIFDWILVLLSYIAAILLFNGTLAYKNNMGAVDLMNPLSISSLVLYGFLLFAQTFLYIFGIIFSFGAKVSLAKHNMIVKIVSIPFFVINFAALVFFIDGIMSENNLLGVFVLLLAIVGTFSIMFRTSLPNVIYFIKNYIRKSLKVTPWGVFALIFSFIYFLDIIGGIILFKHERNQTPEIATKIKEERIKKINEWDNKKHMSLTVFKIGSVITSIILALISISLVAIFISIIVKLFNGSDEFSFEMLDILFTDGLFITAMVVVLVTSFIKFILGIIYGKLGEKNPTEFLFIMKLVDLIPSIALLIISLFALLVGAALDVLAVLLLPFIAVVIMIFVIFAALGVSVIAYASSFPSMLSALFCIWGTSISLFTYWINQRKIKNRKFSSPLIVTCLIFLWIPVLDIPATVILKNKSKNNAILGNNPVIIY